VTPFQALVLGLVQGATEFLPVSSSAHLILASWALGWSDQGLHFDMMANTGSVAAVIVYFRRELAEVLREARGALAGADAPGARLGRALIVGTLPAAVAGILVQEWVATDARQPVVVAVTAIAYGLLLGWADRRREGEGKLADVGIREALIIGFAQALALVPGTSRSGITMTAALFLGFRRTAAARFSFLLAVPVGLLVAGKDVWDLVRGAASAGDWAPLAVVFAASAVSSLLVIAWLLLWLRRRSLLPFALYRVLLGMALLALAWA
jgi:undecaprenyl-diphosphatase